MIAGQLEEEQNEEATTTTAESSDCETAPETSSDEESDVSDHELMVAAGFESAAEAEVADEEHDAAFGRLQCVTVALVKISHMEYDYGRDCGRD